MSVEYKYIKGMAQLEKSMRELPRRIRTKLLTAATSHACDPVLQKAIDNAPMYHGEVSKGHPPPGTLKKAIHKAHLRRHDTGTRVQFVVKVRSATKDFTVKKTRTRIFDVTTGKYSIHRRTFIEVDTNVGAYYWWFVNFGTSKMGGIYFMDRAFDTESPKAIEEFRSFLASELQRLAEEVRNA